MSSPKQTLYRVTTPPGRGAVATVSIVGPGAGEVVASRFEPVDPRWKHELPLRRIVLGSWRSSDGISEELVLSRLAVDRIDVHCHGGPAPVAAIVESLETLGVDLATADAWSRIAEPRLSTIAREARLALADAPTDRTAEILLEQFHGAQERAAREIVAIAAREPKRALAIVDATLAHASTGGHLTIPWKVVIAGRPNVGKSSLVNRLLGYQRAIVFDEPGTTRDVLSATTALAGWPIELYDTAGLRETSEPIEAAGVALARLHIDQADAVVLVAEAPAPWGEDERRLAALVECPVVLYNKVDQGSCDDDAKPTGHRVSAVTGAGLDAAWQALVERLVPCPPEAGAAVPFTSRQIACWREIRESLAGTNLSALSTAMDRLLHDDDAPR